MNKDERQEQIRRIVYVLDVAPNTDREVRNRAWDIWSTLSITNDEWVAAWMYWQHKIAATQAKDAG